MKKFTIAVVGLAVMSAAMQVYADDAAKNSKDIVKAVATAKKPQTTCPVMGGEINKKLYVDVDGKRIYVCCRGCLAAIRKNPAKYIQAMEAQGIELEQVKVKK